MISFMMFLLSFAIASATAWFAYRTARRFVRNRLRYVESAKKGSTPWLTGAAVFLVTLPVTAVLPIVGIGTALAAGLAAGSGVAAGIRDIKKGYIPAIFGQ